MKISIDAGEKKCYLSITIYEEKKTHSRLRREENFFKSTTKVLTSPMDQQVKNLPAMQEIQEMQVPSLGWEDPL